MRTNMRMVEGSHSASTRNMTIAKTSVCLKKRVRLGSSSVSAPGGLF